MDSGSDKHEEHLNFDELHYQGMELLAQGYKMRETKLRHENEAKTQEIARQRKLLAQYLDQLEAEKIKYLQIITDLKHVNEAKTEEIAHRRELLAQCIDKMNSNEKSSPDKFPKIPSTLTPRPEQVKLLAQYNNSKALPMPSPGPTTTPVSTTIIVDCVIFKALQQLIKPDEKEQFTPSRLQMTRRRPLESTASGMRFARENQVEHFEVDISVNPGEKFGFQMRANYSEPVVLVFGVMDKSTLLETEKNMWLLEPTDSNTRKTTHLFLRVGQNVGTERFLISAYKMANGPTVENVKKQIELFSNLDKSHYVVVPRGELLYQGVITCFVGHNM